ncbi:integrase catalytic subunit [Candidatus Symbiobacter mobilis CR]|uniref:Integrase catalytic subunit n=1 Tax=Candidatus Symbiobacter mobilis CR TaxID=946483 RepID=U5NA46_9BURK|nr:integrase catalytic subunit [Candidatus Symbiobacter mobilis CR]
MQGVTDACFTDHLRITVRKLKDALRLKFEDGKSHQQIAHALGISQGAVTQYVGLAMAAALDWNAVSPSP